MVDFLHGKRDGTAENIGFLPHAADVPLQKRHIASGGVHFDDFQVVGRVEPTEFFGKIVVSAVEFFTKQDVFLLHFGFIGVQFFVRISD